MTDRTGQQLGNYRLLRLLGRGGFATVYLGEHIYLNTLAAIKVLDAHLSSEGVDQFREEARTIAHLEHPHIVRVLDFGVEETTPFLVMGYAPNGTLRQLHPTGTRVPPSTIITYVKQAAAALYYAHTQKLIHRDVKPENMLLGRNSEVLLSDFGLAMGTYSSSRDSPRDASGTIAYMAPEQARGKPRPASDQYALAIAVYEWLCGARPFNGSYEEIAVQHVLHEPPSLCRFHSGISPAMEVVVLKALVKDPHQRFATVQDFADALEQAHSTGMLPGGITPSLTPPTHDETSSEDALHRASTRTDRTQTPAIHAIAWSPDRRRIASGGHDRTVRVWDVTTALVSLIYRGHVAGVTTLAWSHDGQRIASASLDKTVQVWDAANGQKIASYDGHSGMIHAVAWSPDGQSIASASGGGQDKAVQLWNASTGAHIYTYPDHTYWVRAVAWSPDGKWIASGSLKEVQIWNAASGHKISSFRGHEGWVRALAWSPDGKHIASTSEDKAVQVWEVARGRLISTYRGHNEWVSSIAWSSDGKHIVSISKDALVQVWDVEYPQHILSSRTSSHGLSFHAHPSSTHAVVWLPDDRHIASACGDGSVQVWQAI